MLPSSSTHHTTNESYLDTLTHLRERVNTLNAQLPTSNTTTTVETHPLRSTDGMTLSRSDRALLLRGKQAATRSFAFRASLSEFGQHWETMTYSQQHQHLTDYIVGQYGEHEHLVEIQTFLVQHVLKTPSGSRRVTWNGYFVERVTEVDVVKGGCGVRVRFLAVAGPAVAGPVVVKATVTVKAKANAKTNANKGGGVFQAMRNRVKLEKAGFFRGG